MSTKTKKKTDVYQIVTDRILKIMEKGIIPWRKPWNSAAGSPRNYDGRPYRGINYLLAIAYCFDNDWKHPVFITRKKAEKLGATVKKGSKSVPITLWKMFVPEEYISCPDACPAADRRFYLRYYRVFNVSQVEGLPAMPELEERGTAHDPNSICEAIIAGYPSPPKMSREGLGASYSPVKDLVKMPPLNDFDTPAGFYTTFFHELAHSTGHTSRLDRPEIQGASFGTDPYAKEELVAEMGAAFLSAHAGIDMETLGNTVAYLQSWSKRFKEQPKLLVQAAAQAQKATDHILDMKPDYSAPKPKAKPKAKPVPPTKKEPTPLPGELFA